MKDGLAVRIGIVEDHALVSDGYRQLIQLNQDWRVTRNCASVGEARQSDLEQNTDLVIVDLSLPDGSGFDVIRHLKSLAQTPKIIVVSMYEHFHYVAQAMALGVEGYVSKTAASDELIDAISEVLQGECYYSESVASNYHAFKQNNTQDRLNGLTSREWEIFKLLCLGFGPKRVSQRLNLQPKTVFAHRANIYRKLDIDNQFDLLKFALKVGAVELNELTSNDKSPGNL